MNHPKTGEQELERLAEKYAEANEGDNHYSGFKAGYRAAESETELLRNAAEFTRNFMEDCPESIVQFEQALKLLNAALADDKASQGDK